MRMLPASCTPPGIVTIESLPIADAVILSEGTKASNGIAIVDKGEVTYITSSAQDLKQAITDLSVILDSVIAILTAHDAVTVAPGGSSAAIAALTTLKTTFLASKEMLK